MWSSCDYFNQSEPSWHSAVIPMCQCQIHPCWLQRQEDVDASGFEWIHEFMILRQSQSQHSWRPFPLHIYAQTHRNLSVNFWPSLFKNQHLKVTIGTQLWVLPFCVWQSVTSWTRHAGVTEVSTMPQANPLLLFIGREWTNMAAPFKNSNYKQISTLVA